MTRVLVVDDEKSIRLTLCYFLSDAGYEVATAETVDSAKAMLQKHAFDVVISDIVLPGASGVDLLQFVRETMPSIQVIMMTGQPTVETASRTVRLSASDYLAKPVGKNALLRSVTNATRMKRVEDERRALVETLRTKYAEVEDLAEKRERLLHLLHHDVSNALAGAIAMVEKEKSTVAQYSASDRSLQSMLTHCESVIRDVRTRETESLTTVQLEVADLSALLEESCTTLSATAAAKQVEVCVNVEPGISVLVRPGPFVLHVLNNILSNAIKFSYPESRIEIDVTTEDAWVILACTDHGRGISHDHLAQQMDQPFTTPGTAGEPGTGYGLRHVRQCMEELGGSVSIESTHESETLNDPVAAGTTVTIRIKRAAAPDPGATPPPASDPGDAVDKPGAETTARATTRRDSARKASGIIVVDDAWPVTDALCLAFADTVAALDPNARLAITYARMQGIPRDLRESADLSHVDLKAMQEHGHGADPASQLATMLSELSEGVLPILVIQEKTMIRRFYELLDDAAFRKQMTSTFGIFAADYALGLPFYGTDMLERAGSDMHRVLISANAEEYLPDDYRASCDTRIDKSKIRIATLARRILDLECPQDPSETGA